MPYIETSDYIMHIQDVNMQEIINNNETIRTKANLLAMAEAQSYLIQKYDINAEFAKTGDDRDQQMLSTIVDIALFHIHKRIAPRNIPQLRQNAYDAAIEWLKMCAYGDITPALAKIVPTQGMRIRYGGHEKNNNTY